jgi:hypothetical protein
MMKPIRLPQALDPWPLWRWFLEQFPAWQVLALVPLLVFSGCIKYYETPKKDEEPPERGEQVEPREDDEPLQPIRRREQIQPRRPQRPWGAPPAGGAMPQQPADLAPDEQAPQSAAERPNISREINDRGGQVPAQAAVDRHPADETGGSANRHASRGSPTGFPGAQILCGPNSDEADRLIAGIRAKGWTVGAGPDSQWQVIRRPDVSGLVILYFDVDGRQIGRLNGFHDRPGELTAIMAKHRDCNFDAFVGGHGPPGACGSGDREAAACAKVWVTDHWECH